MEVRSKEEEIAGAELASIWGSEVMNPIFRNWNRSSLLGSKLMDQNPPLALAP